MQPISIITPETLEIMLLNGAISIFTILALAFYSDVLIRGLNDKTIRSRKNSEDQEKSNIFSGLIARIFKMFE